MPAFRFRVLVNEQDGVGFAEYEHCFLELADAANFLDPPQILLVDERVNVPPGA